MAKKSRIEIICAYPRIIKMRWNNVVNIFPKAYKGDIGRFQDYKDACNLIRKHPWWMIQWKPKIPQNDSPHKMAFSMIRGPVWRWEKKEIIEEIERTPNPETLGPASPEEIKELVQRARERWWEQHEKAMQDNA